MRVFHHFKRPKLALSPREAQILELVNQGLTSRLIAEQLGISIHTVTNHRATIKDKQKEVYVYSTEVQPVR